jgi:hypothetical protein
VLHADTFSLSVDPATRLVTVVARVAADADLDATRDALGAALRAALGAGAPALWDETRHLVVDLANSTDPAHHRQMLVHAHVHGIARAPHAHALSHLAAVAREVAAAQPPDHPIHGAITTAETLLQGG